MQRIKLLVITNDAYVVNVLFLEGAFMILIVLLLLALYPAASQAQQSASERMAARLRQLASEVRAQVPTNLNTLNMNAASAATCASS